MRADPHHYSEEECSAAIKGLLSALNVEWYSTEAGYMGHFDAEGNRHDRKGGTRTTAGIPDLLAYPTQPLYYRLTVEFKGRTTNVSLPQWRYALHRAERGEPHLIVRSPQAFLNGLRFLGLLPPAWVDRPPVLLPGQTEWKHVEGWPVNVNYLAQTRGAFWKVAGKAPSYAYAVRLPDLRLPSPPHPRGIGLERLGPNSPLR